MRWMGLYVQSGRTRQGVAVVQSLVGNATPGEPGWLPGEADCGTGLLEAACFREQWRACPCELPVIRGRVRRGKSDEIRSELIRRSPLLAARMAGMTGAKLRLVGVPDGVRPGLGMPSQGFSPLLTPHPPLPRNNRRTWLCRRSCQRAASAWCTRRSANVSAPACLLSSPSTHLTAPSNPRPHAPPPHASLPRSRRPRAGAEAGQAGGHEAR